MTTAIASDPYAALNAASSTGTTASTTASTSDAGSADRFLKLLVTQMQNQDPLNPMDNAQITSQMAEINTVSGIQQLNTTVSALNTQFVQMQALQGASLVGHDITLQGNLVDIQNGVGTGGFDLSGTADRVSVEISDAAGHVVGSVDLGAQMAGRQSFSWDASQAAPGMDYRFRVVATKGTTAVASTALMRDQVVAVTSTASGLVLETQRSGDVAYADVKAFN